MTDAYDPLRRAALSFRESCVKDGGAYALTPCAEPTAFARCFAVFIGRLCGAGAENKDAQAQALEAEMRLCRARAAEADLRGKSYRQLLTFTLSALAALGALKPETLADLIEEQITQDVRRDLTAYGCLQGKAGSGNQAMFTALFLLHGRDVLGLKTQSRLDAWTELHLRAMNRFGFWGPDLGMTHLQFQNGYHQYEILEYLGVSNPKQAQTVATVRGLADSLGHFAPYPGGGGCYDYDAVFLLTPQGRIPDEETRLVLGRTAATLAAERRPEGGFAESLYVRPRSWPHLSLFARHVLQAAGFRAWPLFAERLRYALTLQRPCHDRIATHWSLYARRWDEADLWDTWFRLLALARIEAALDPAKAAAWGFIDYPGIGFHPSLRKGTDA